MQSYKTNKNMKKSSMIPRLLLNPLFLQHLNNFNIQCILFKFIKVTVSSHLATSVFFCKIFGESIPLFYLGNTLPFFYFVINITVIQIYNSIYDNGH